MTHALRHMQNIYICNFDARKTGIRGEVMNYDVDSSLNPLCVYTGILIVVNDQYLSPIAELLISQLRDYMTLFFIECNFPRDTIMLTCGKK